MSISEFFLYISIFPVLVGVRAGGIRIIRLGGIIPFE
jgi:hypothetical protein